MSEIQGTSLLSASEESELAEQIEQLEIVHWECILAYPPAVERVRAALQPSPPQPLNELAAAAEACRCAQASASRPQGAARAKRLPTSWGTAVSRAASALRELDTTREILVAADAAVRSAYSATASRRDYLTKVARAREAQQAAKHRFVAANLRLVLAMARRYDTGRIPLPDLVQEGNVGLMLAVERFDHRRGFRFSTYAGWWIRHCLTRAVANDSRLIRVPVHTLAAAQQTVRAQEVSAIKTGRDLSDDELALATGLSLEKVEFVKQHVGLARPSSLDQLVGKDGDRTLHDVVAGPSPSGPEEAIDLAQWHDKLEALMQVLTPIEASILRYRFGLNDDHELTLREIGDKYQLSRERIRQVQNEALHKLRAEVRRTQVSRH